MINKQEIKSFIEGRNPEKYIIAIEGDRSTNYVDVFYNDPEKGKYMMRDKYKPFLWANINILSKLYGGNRNIIKEKCKQYDITIKKLRTEDVNGFEPERLRNGYKFIVQTKKSFYDISNFFKYGGVNIYGSKDVVTLSPEEQYMVQTSKRLFKGMDSYDDVLRLQYDIETTGLSSKNSHTYAIGCKTNKGFEKIFRLEDYDFDTLEEKESLMYIDFFQTVRDINPDIIGTYNGEFFDWSFILERFEILGLDKDLVVKTLSDDKPIERYKSTLKLGQETENFMQTKMYGTNIIDISHSVKKAKAINSEIKGWSLKYITKYAELNKENRVYINGDNIHKTYISKEPHALNDENGDWYIITDKTPLKEGYSIVTGQYIADRYLLDDIYETECVDFHFNQAAFLVSKLTPTTYTRSITMGSASLWKLILCAWSYENNLAVPEYQPKQKFTGGLSRLLETGFAENVAKLDYAALYPNIELTWDIFPDLDITGVMKGMLLYIAETRDEYKELKNHYASIGDKKTSSFYDTQQLPLKILANSFFGAFGAPYIFNWGDVNCAEETTCRGRQYLRLMVSHFHEKYKFKPLVGDSVTGRTPIYIKYNETDEIDILPIRHIFNATNDILDIDGQQRDFNYKPFKVLTKNGWSSIEYVYRHKTKKDIHRIETSESMVECTSDHSLFNPSGEEITPKKLKRGSKLMLSKEIINNELHYTDMNEDKAWLIGFFIADGSSIYGDRKTRSYFSKRKGRFVEHNSKRSEWTLNNSDYDKLAKAKILLLNEYGIDAPIKDYRNSSNVYKLKTHYASLSKEFSSECYCNNRLKKIPKKILNANKNIKKAFLDGFCCGDGYGDTIDTCLSITQKSQTVLAGIALLSKELGYNYRISSRKDKPNVLDFDYLTHNGYKINNSKSKKKPDEVWNNYNVIQDDEYVYDISAEGTFIAGIGNIVCHNTDGFNFAIPKEVDEIEYLCQGTHRLTEKNKGKLLRGLDAVVSDFNEKYMIGRMGLDIDDICTETINFTRKNYSNNILKFAKDGSTYVKMKMVGNTLKSGSLPKFMEEFINKGVKYLMSKQPREFVNLYYSIVDDLYNYKIPVAKLASKSRVKLSKEEYLNYIKGFNKAGNNMSRQAHMELVLKEDLNVGLGDTIYYYNIGKTKSVSDIKNDKVNNIIKFNCKLVSNDIIEYTPDHIETDYNIPKYIDMLNTKLKTLMVVFNKDVRTKLPVKITKDKKTKEYILSDKYIFTDEDLTLISGIPIEPENQDSYDDMMVMEDKEVKFWLKVNKLPNNMDESVYNQRVELYHKNMQERRGLIFNEYIEKLNKIKPKLSAKDYQNLMVNGSIPKKITNHFKVNEETLDLYIDDYFLGDIVIANLSDI